MFNVMSSSPHRRVHLECVVIASSKIFEINEDQTYNRRQHRQKTIYKTGNKEHCVCCE